MEVWSRFRLLIVIKYLFLDIILNIYGLLTRLIGFVCKGSAFVMYADLDNLFHGDGESFTFKGSPTFVLLVLQLLLRMLLCNYLMVCRSKTLLVLNLALQCCVEEFISVDCQGLNIWRSLPTR